MSDHRLYKNLLALEVEHMGNFTFLAGKCIANEKHSKLVIFLVKDDVKDIVWSTGKNR